MDKCLNVEQRESMIPSNLNPLCVVCLCSHVSAMMARERQFHDLLSQSTSPLGQLDPYTSRSMDMLLPLADSDRRRRALEQDCSISLRSFSERPRSVVSYTFLFFQFSLKHLFNYHQMYQGRHFFFRQWGFQTLFRLPSFTNVLQTFCGHLCEPGWEWDWWVKSSSVLLEFSGWWPRLGGTLENLWSFQSSSSEKWRTWNSWEPSGLWGFFCSLLFSLSSFYTRTLCQLMSNNVNLPHVDSNQESQRSQRWRNEKQSRKTRWRFYFWLSFFISGKTQRPTQRVSFQPPAAEPIRHLHHRVRLASPTRETYSGLLRVWSNCESCFTDFKRKTMPRFFDQIERREALLSFL